MRIVHFSDWHWNFRELPEADLYVCTGDMYDNYPQPHVDSGWRHWQIIPAVEIAKQDEAVKNFVAEGGFRQFLKSPDAPIVCVAGNHDFIPLARLFEGCNLLHEFVNNELIEVNGKRVTGHQGIPYIYGTWNHEYSRGELSKRCLDMPYADLFLTHYPPYEILDHAEDYKKGMTHFGLDGMLKVLVDKMQGAGLHCFGHIHECGGQTKTRYGYDMWFSNAATAINVIDF